MSTQSKNASVVFVGTYTEFEGGESEGIYVYRMDLENGKLHKKAEVDVQPGAGPRHLTFHPNGQFAYLVNELNSTWIGYRDDTKNGTFEELQTVPALPQDFKDENHVTLQLIRVEPSCWLQIRKRIVSSPLRLTQKAVDYPRLGIR